jgi:hypothetical protein
MSIVIFGVSHTRQQNTEQDNENDHRSLVVITKYAQGLTEK